MNDTSGRFYRLLMRFLPRPLRERFGDEMLRLHADLLRDAKERGAAPWRTWIALIKDTLSSAVVDRRALAQAPGPLPNGPPVTVVKVPPSKRKPLGREELVVSRRQFLNRAWTLTCMGTLGFLGMGSLSYLWPRLTEGFGTSIKVGNYEDLLAKVGPAGGFKPLFVPEGRFWLTYYDGDGDDPVYAATGAATSKLQAIYRKCVHLGCSVPICTTSMLFECPCHGSKYRLSGEYYLGPAPRGLDRFSLQVVEGEVIVDTGSVQEGPPRGTDTWPKFSQPAGPYCQPAP